LVLKHRQNKNQRQRIIVFVASPIEEDEKTLVKLGKKLKKNNVAVDVVNFGQEQENEAKLTAFMEAVNNNDNSHLVTIPPGPHLLSDVLISSPIIQGEDGPPPGFGGNFEFGVDPSLDPELAMVCLFDVGIENVDGGGKGSSREIGWSGQFSPETSWRCHGG
jgi:26S proteasome regulatory subunit N10